MTTRRQTFSALFHMVLVGLTAAALAAATASATAQTVTTPGGTFPAATFHGAAGAGITTFKGIRFAAAPTGALRFAPPTAPAAVAGAIDATTFGSSCPQSASPFGTASTNEDCLFLNVFVPGSVSSWNNLPVMVFFHGGAFVFGEGSDYDPTQMAIQGNVIVVTINYRLGILGYLADAALSAESASGVSGNYGLEDQQFALRWVQQNISAFGGDPRNVTIFGESAGGFSVCASIVSPKATGLFQGAITESGPCATPLPSLKGAEAQGAAIVGALGCNDLSSAATVACLRNLPVSSILTEQNNVTAAASLASLAAFFPNVDGDVIPQQPATALIFGQFNHVPVIEGTNGNEGALFVALGFDLNPRVGPLTAAGYPVAILGIADALVQVEAAQISGSTSATLNATQQQQAQQIANEILQRYPLGNFGNNPGKALSAVLTDSLFSCSKNTTDGIFALSVPVFGYEFNDANAPMIFLPPVSFPYGATHTDELQFLFTIAGQPSRLSSSEQTLATTMKAYWTNFARNGNPNSFGEPGWPSFNFLADDDQSLVAPTPRTENNLSAAHNCNFWTGVLIQTTLEAIANQLRANGLAP
jgi:para-nitrobenzyl esterase